MPEVVVKVGAPVPVIDVGDAPSEFNVSASALRPVMITTTARATRAGFISMSIGPPGSGAKSDGGPSGAPIGVDDYCRVSVTV